MLRVSPSIDPHTHLLTTTGILDSKFGFSIETGAAEKAVEQALRADNLEVMGLHFHLGSPIFELEPYSQATDYVLKFAAQMREKHGLRMREFNPGGGIPYETPSHERVLAFQSILRAHFPCFIRRPRGREIYAACGQLKRTLGENEIQEGP